MQKSIIISAVLTGFVLWSGAALGKDDQFQAHYSAVAVPTTGLAAGESTTLDIRITGETPDAEVRRLVKLLKEKGQEALVDELDTYNLGEIGPTGSVGTDLAVVRVHPTDNGKNIRLITIRYMPFVERFLGGRSTNYPFAMAEFTVDQDGKGEGRLIVGAKVKINDQGVIVIESYNEKSFVRLLNVRRLD